MNLAGLPEVTADIQFNLFNFDLLTSTLQVKMPITAGVQTKLIDMI